MVQWAFLKFASFAREFCEQESLRLDAECDRLLLYVVAACSTLLWAYMLFHFMKKVIETGKYVLLILIWLTVLLIWTYIWFSSIQAVRLLEPTLLSPAH